MSTRRARFAAWSRRRPLVGAILIAVGGVEMFFSGQLDLGNIQVQLGFSGLQATIIPVALVLLGVLIVAMPMHRIFYGVIALAISIYSLVGVNLGGFIIGMVVSTVGGVIAVSWVPADGERRLRRREAKRATRQDEEAAAEEGDADGATADLTIDEITAASPS
ncbi:DUF6114 domain-containing protein [Microbacterium sp. SCN 71-21]|uniref:DUF6114 domain-containing protein n=1 Tax=Microbacterium sp. SCN 71-21 TaxID=1660116 RepID=UPI000B30A9A4|nr:DUF6114 domain-containing protein [Microbacterium sp. SCN 71-21]